MCCYRSYNNLVKSKTSLLLGCFHCFNHPAHIGYGLVITAYVCLNAQAMCGHTTETGLFPLKSWKKIFRFLLLCSCSNLAARLHLNLLDVTLGTVACLVNLLPSAFLRHTPQQYTETSLEGLLLPYCKCLKWCCCSVSSIVHHERRRQRQTGSFFLTNQASLSACLHGMIWTIKYDVTMKFG